MSFSRLTSIVTTPVLFACGGGGGDAGPQPIDQCPGPSLAVRPRLADARADAAPGAVTANITGDFARTITGPASAFSRTLFPAFLVADAFTVDAAGRPTGELFVFAPGTPTVGNRALVPVTLQDVHDPNFIPSGPFVVWAEAFDNALGDYSRWFLGDSGTLGITTFRDAPIGRGSLTVSVSGTWRSATGARLGCGRIVGATIDAPVVRGASPTAGLIDTVEASIAGARTETIGSQTIDAFQTLRAGDTRLLFVATMPGDSTRELWLSLNGARLVSDSVPLRELSLEAARAGRDTVSFAMIRVITLSGTTPTVAEIWRSTSGWVKLTNLVPGAPLILCGWGSARFSFRAAGHNNATGGSLGTLDATGALEARYTVMSPVDSLVGLRASHGIRLRMASPGSARNRRCFL